jgi:hypothetical protein
VRARLDIRPLKTQILSTRVRDHLIAIVEVWGVKTTVERVTLSLEEEARGFIAWRLKEALGVEVALDKVFVDALEINVYGVTGDLCVVGEATVRLGLGLVEELL